MQCPHCALAVKQCHGAYWYRGSVWNAAHPQPAPILAFLCHSLFRYSWMECPWSELVQIKHLYKHVVFVSRAVALHIQALVPCMKEHWLGVWRRRRGRRHSVVCVFQENVHLAQLPSFCMAGWTFHADHFSCRRNSEPQNGMFCLGESLFLFEHLGGLFLFSSHLLNTSK